VSDSQGNFTIQTTTASRNSLTLTSEATISRVTQVHVPGEIRVSVIPDSFDLDAFEEYAPRVSGLRRWTSAPRLQVLKTVIDYATARSNFTEFRTTDREINNPGLDCTLGEMRRAIGDLSGGNFSFTSEETIVAPANSTFRTRDVPLNTIVLLFAQNLGANGRGTAYTDANPLVFERGVVFLSAGALPLCSPTAERVIPHEVGHALGYAPRHIFKQPSIMGSPPSFPMTPFDLDAIDILYGRPPGNRAPDNDPDDYSLNAAPSQLLSLEPPP
jgi:hypothetical protein